MLSGVNILKLPARLTSIVQFIPPGSTVADIGTDHALLPVYLVEKGIASAVVAGDLNPGPLESARRNVAAAGLTGHIIIRQGNGLDITKPGEAETAVIAGMGGAAIRRILQDMTNKGYQPKRLILQPMGEAGILREWLADHGWYIAGEDLVREEGRIYEIISAAPGFEETPDRVILSIGPRLFEQRHPLLAELLAGEIERNKRAVTETKKSTAQSAGLKREQLLDRTADLERVVECLLNAKP